MKTRKKSFSIHKFSNRTGSVTYYVDLRKIGQGKKGFPTLQEAKTYAEGAWVKFQNEGTVAFNISDGLRLDAVRAHEILGPENVSLLDAAKHYRKTVLAFKHAPPVKDIVDRLIESREKLDRRPRTLTDLKSRLKQGFAANFGDAKLNDITLDELIEWLDDDAWGPLTRIGYATKISQLYNFAIKRGWAEKNVAALIDRPSVEEKPVEIFSVEEAGKLLSHAQEFGLLPFIAIGLFAGVRTEEQIRLASGAINFDTKTITIGADAAKKRSQRVIEMSETLLAWLEPVKDQLKKPIFAYTAGVRSQKEDLLEAAGVTWKDNGLRHSFGSYHFAKYQDANRTSHDMGNSLDMVHKHYKALVSKTEAEKFWSLRPKVADNVVMLKAG